jgi:transposase
MNNHHPNRALSVQELEARRIKAGKLFTQGKTAYFVAKKFGVSSTTAREWRERWKNGTLNAQPQGRTSLLTDEQKARVSKSIIKGQEAVGYKTQLWTLERITTLIRKTEKTSYKPRSVWHLLHALGFSCQKPVRRAKERNEQAIAQWKQTTWPKMLKKGLH